MAKILKIFSALFFMSVTAWAQDVDSSPRNVSLKIVDRRGRPIESVVVSSQNNTQVGLTDRNGLFVFENMTDEDFISVMLPRVGEATIPVAGLDSIVVTQRAARRFSYTDDEGLAVAINRDKIQPSTLLDVPAMLKQRHVSSLSDLLRGNVPGLTVSLNNTANIRGPSSFNLSTEPLVILDGIPFGTLNEANDMLNVYDIQSIEVLNSASEYGMRGANGVILIKTKTANSQ